MTLKSKNNTIKVVKAGSISSVKGFSLLELMITMVLGLFLFAGVMSIFVGMRSTTAATSAYGELQENGRFAISVLTEDLIRQDFWGDFSGVMSFANLIAIPGNPASDCVGEGVNNATFPSALGNFRTLWGDTVTSGSSDPLDCFPIFSSAIPRFGSDVIQIKRVISNPDVPLVAGNFYFTGNTVKGAFHTSAGVPVIENSQTWLYQHHVYFVRDDFPGHLVPVLMQGRLENSNMSFTPLIDGIEIIRFMYGVGQESTGVVDRYLSADTMNNNSGLWDKADGTRILAVKIYVLARSIEPDRKYENKNTYQIGDLALAVDDNYRRLLFSSTVTLYNGRVDSW